MPGQRAKAPEGTERACIVDALARHLIEARKWEQVAQDIGVDPSTLRGWRAADWWPDLAKEAIDEHAAELLNAARAGLVAKIREGNPRAARFALKWLDRERFTPPKTGEVTIINEWRNETRKLGRRS